MKKSGMSEIPKQSVPKNISEMSFEQALAELESTVRRLEEGCDQLETAISAYQRGNEMRRHCEAKLREAQARIDCIMQGSDDALETKAYDIPKERS